MERADRARLRAQDSAQLLSLRAQITSAKRAKAARMIEVRGMCRAQRAERTLLAQRMRAELRETIKGMRELDKGLCDAGKDRTRETAEKAIGGAKTEAAWVRENRRIVRGSKAKGSGRGSALKRAAELRAESDDEVRGNIARELVPVWEHRKRHTHATPRASRTEVFLEWVQENSAAVYEILDAENVRSLARLEREERALAREMARPARYQGGAAVMAHRVETHSDEWGG